MAVCDEWLNDNRRFFEWAIHNGYADNLTINRIDVDGNYEPNNCRWITLQQQNRNTIRNRYFTINGITKCLKDWCISYNIPCSTVRYRLKQGQNIEQALEIDKK